MKKLFLFLVVLFCIVNANAQIQRTFFGFSFGAPANEVVQTLKNQGFTVNDVPNGVVAFNIYQSVSFGGIDWGFVSVKFYKNKFYDITFHITDKYAPPKRIVRKYSELKDRLDAKYNKYNREEFNDKNIQWYDDRTGCICSYTYTNGIEAVDYETSNINMYLRYYDRNTTVEMWNDRNNEL